MAPTPPLARAAGNGDLAEVRRLLAAGAEVGEAGAGPESYGGRGWAALHWAAFEGHAEVLRALLAAQADVDSADTQGSTPLLVAAAAAQLETVKAILGLGANQNVSLPYTQPGT